MATPISRRESAIFKALGAPQRLQVMQLLLASDHELCSTELAQRVGIPLYTMSRHLKIIRAAGLVEERREGRHVYYTPHRRDEIFLRAIHQAVTALNSELIAPRAEASRDR